MRLGGCPRSTHSRFACLTLASLFSAARYSSSIVSLGITWGGARFVVVDYEERIIVYVYCSVPSVDCNFDFY